MDLTTTKMIKRRTINIIPDPTQEVTNCSITVSNWFQNIDTSNKKFRVSSFYLNNSALPCFIGKWMSSEWPSNWWGVGAGTITNSTIGPNSLDYHFNIHNLTNDYGSTVVMDPNYSQYPLQVPSVHSSTEFQQLSNKYFWFFNTSQFLEMLGKQINDVIGANSLSQYGVAFVRTQQGYGLYVPTTLTDELQFSQTLIDLFQFKCKNSSNSPSYLKTVEFNAQLRNYYVEDLTAPGTFASKPCFFVASNYVPDTWFPFDLLLIKTTLPTESETFYDNNNYISQNYQNIMLTYKIQNNNPDGIYNFYTSNIDPQSGWLSMVGTNSSDNCKFDILLRLQRTKDIVPYQIKASENAYFVTEEITTVNLY